MEEADLVEACKLNDRRAQRHLFEKYKDAMFTTAYRIVNDYDHASDVLQESFIKVFKNIDSFKGYSAIGAWIKTIVVRTAIRKIKFESRFESLDHKAHDTPVEWSDELTGFYLDKAIRSLPDGFRTVFLLVEVEGYKHKEVAELLKISENTSKSQLHHAKKNLRKKLIELYHK